MVIEEATEVTPELVEAMAGLVQQLSQSAPPPTATDLAEIVTSPATRLLIARDAPEGQVIGSLTLVLFRIPTGMRAWIEDVVVAESSRGQGTGQALISAAVDIASAAGCRTVDLTSRPSREAANRLYQKAGFTERDTNVYRMELKAKLEGAPIGASRGPSGPAAQPPGAGDDWVPPGGGRRRASKT